MATPPVRWQKSTNPPLTLTSEIYVDKRLTTITPTNPKGYVKLSTTTTNATVNELYYSIDLDGKVTFAVLDDKGDPVTQYNTIDEILNNQVNYEDIGPLIANSLLANLIQRTNAIIINQTQQPSSYSENGVEVQPVDFVPFDEKEIKDVTNYKFAPQTGLRYPEDLASTKQDRIMFTAKKIKPRTISATEKANLQFDFGKLDFDNADDGSVIIAIQSPINDQNSVDWGGDNVNPIDAALFGLSLDLINSGKNPEGVSNKLQTFLTGLYGTAKGQQSRIQRYLAGQAANINNVLARTDGVILNPNYELLFNGPQLRPFTFTFKMSARSGKEAKIIKQIINYFKYHMAPRKEKPAVFLKAPHVFDIKYCYNGNEIEKDDKGSKTNQHPGINKIKTCALTNFSVDYTPLGSYMTYEDGTMVAYTLNMQFQELTPVYDDDYSDYQLNQNNGENSSSVHIGY